MLTKFCGVCLGAHDMNKVFLSFTAAFGAVLIAAPVLADEAPAARPVRHVARAPVEAPARAAPVQQANWTGGQVGGQGGVSSMAQGFAEPGSHLFPDFGTCALPGFGSYCVETPFAFTGHNTSATGGAFLGYRAQLGWWVIGAEIDANYKSGSSSAALSDANLFRSESFYGTMKQTGDASLRLRAGVLVTPWTLVYGTGGAAVGDISGSFAYAAHENPAFFLGACLPTHCASVTGGQSWSDVRTGWTAGGGIEYLVLPNVTLRVEYRYTDFGFYQKYVPLSTHNCVFVGATGCTAPTSNAVIDLHPTFNAVRAGVAFNF
jgi:outer membrane immunogenic protein